MPVSTYGAYNPQATDPYPIENALAAAVAKDNPDLAYPMLLRYGLQRENAGNQYGNELTAQHQFAQQQLAATMAHNAASDVAGLLDKPGGAALLAGAPDYRYLLGGAGDDVISGIATNAQRAQDAKIAHEAGGAAQEFVNAGVDVPASSWGQMTNLPTAAGTPLQLRVEAAKAAHAANAVPKLPTFSYGFTDKYGNQVTGTGGGKTSLQTADDVERYKQQNFGVPGRAVPPTTPGAKTPPSQTSLPPMAARDTPANAPQSAGQQIAAFINSPQGTPQMKAAVASTGGTPKVRIEQNGTATLLDSKGNAVQNFKVR